MMQSREEEQISQRQHEGETIRLLETQTPENDLNSSEVDNASALSLKESEEDGTVESISRCLTAINHELKHKSNIKIQNKYEQRITNLQDLVLNVRKKLREEKEWWDIQIAELKIKVLDYSPDYLDYCSSPKNSFAVDVPPQLESPTENSVFNFALNNKESIEYERKLKCYQEALSLAQFEKHQNVKRQLAAHAYKKKLLEIEQLCNLELSRIRQNTCMLDPLNKMAAEWNRTYAESTSDKTWKSQSFSASHSGKIPVNLCDLNITNNEVSSLNLFGEDCKADMTTCLNLISGQPNGLNEALVKNDKPSNNPISMEKLLTERELQRNEFESVAEYNKE